MNKIISFAFAGGNKYSFQKICMGLSRFTTIQYRRDDFLEITSMDSKMHLFIDRLLAQVKTEIQDNSNYIIYGHSMGALIAYLICHRIADLRLRSPRKLVVSGKKVPFLIKDKNISDLPDEEFWHEIMLLEGIPAEMDNYPELINYYLPIFRYDFSLIESYQYEKKERLNIPIDVFFGTDEAKIEDMEGWQNETTGQVTITELPGNHFFIFNHADYFLNYFRNLQNEVNVKNID